MSRLETYLLKKDVTVVQQILESFSKDLWLGNDPQIIVRELQGPVRNLALQLSSYILKQEPQKVELAEKEFTVRASVQVPNTFWDWFKYNYIPYSWYKWEWLKPRLETFESTTTERIVASTDVTIVYPKLKMAVDNQQIVVRCDSIKWHREEL